MPKKIFIDYASTTPVSPVVMQAMAPYWSEKFYNPSALYLAAKGVKQDLEAARADVALTLGVRPSEIVFTAGTTEANNLVIKGVMAANPQAHCVVSVIEHDSVIQTAKEYDHSLLPVTEAGIIDIKAAESLIKPNTVLVSCMLANNELGTIQPLSEMSKLINKVRALRAKEGNKTPLYLHTDAAQAFNYMQVLPHTLGADFVVISGSKIYGPKQMAALYLKTGSRVVPQLRGGGQEWGMRPGTENVAEVIGLAAAMKETSAMRESEAKRAYDLQTLFIDLLKTKLPQVRINGSVKHRLPNNVHITIPDADNETIIMQLDEAGIMAAAGSACSASNDEPSHVLKAIGLTESEARSSLRFTMGRHTEAQDVKHLVDVLAGLLQ